MADHIVNIEPLTQEAFTPFGKVMTLPSAPPAGTGRNYKFWVGLGELPKGNVSMGMVQTTWDTKPIEMLEAHTEPEMMIAVEKPVVLLVAKPQPIFDANAKPKAEETKVFLMQPGQGVLFAAGAWHYVPMPLEGEASCIFIINPGMKGHGNTDEHWVKFENNVSVVVNK